MLEQNITTTDQLAPIKRVGHKGAGGVAPGNTKQSFNAALAAGVDMIEFDVTRERRTGKLLLAHDQRDARRKDVLSLEEGLEYLASDSFAGIELVVDMKTPGYEKELIQQLQTHDLASRSMICSLFPWSLSKLRKLDGSIRLGLSIACVGKLNLRSKRLTRSANGVVDAVSRKLVRWAERSLASGNCNSIMANWHLCSKELADSVRAAGGELYAWTVDERQGIQSIAALGVTGIISNDPRLFTDIVNTVAGAVNG